MCLARTCSRIAGADEYTPSVAMASVQSPRWISVRVCPAAITCALRHSPATSLLTNQALAGPKRRILVLCLATQRDASCTIHECWLPRSIEPYLGGPFSLSPPPSVCACLCSDIRHPTIAQDCSPVPMVFSQKRETRAVPERTHDDASPRPDWPLGD